MKDLLTDVLDEVERIANEMPPPNPYTPQLLSLVTSARIGLAKEKMAWTRVKDARLPRE